MGRKVQLKKSVECRELETTERKIKEETSSGFIGIQMGKRSFGSR